MGTEFYSYEEASKKLGKSYRTIKLYAKQGMLHKVYDGNKTVGVTRESVDNMLQALSLDGDPFNRFSVATHGKQIKSLEDRMAKIEFELGLTSKSLRNIPPEQAEAIWTAANKMTDIKSDWSFEDIKMWIELIGGFEEETLTTIAERVVSARPWNPFLNVLYASINYLSGPKFIGNKAASIIQSEAESTLKKFRSVILFWTLQKEGNVLKRLPGMSVRDVLEELGIGFKAKRLILQAISGGRGR